MIQPTPYHGGPPMKRAHRELIDDNEEELEMAREDWDRVERGVPARPGDEDSSGETRNRCFKEFFSRQGERAKMYDWIVATGHRLVIVFAGRDGAGQGGTTKCITERLNPRMARVAVRPAHSRRKRTLWRRHRIAVLQMLHSRFRCRLHDEHFLISFISLFLNMHTPWVYLA